MTQALLEKPNRPTGGDEGVGRYLKEIRRYPLLDDQQEQALAILAEQGIDAYIIGSIVKNDEEKVILE